MNLAAEKARVRQPESDPYVVAVEDVDAVFAELIHNAEALKRIAGLQEESREPPAVAHSSSPERPASDQGG